MSSSLYPWTSDVFRAFAFYAALLFFKMTAMTFLTVYYRLFKRVFANAEDAQCIGGRVALDDIDIERIRRIHANDMENIIPFWAIGFLYVSTSPCPIISINAFRIFTASRFMHTFIYLYAIRQPARGLAFLVGAAINIFMATMVLLTFFF